MKPIKISWKSALALSMLLFLITSCQDKKEKDLIETGGDEQVTLNTTNTFLVISDSHLHKGVNQDAITGADSGEDLWKITLEKFNELINGKGSYPKPDFVVLLGDLPYHADPNLDLSLAHESTGIVLKDLREAAQNANVPLIYSPGNNDSWSGDYRAFKAPNGDIPFDQDSTAIKDWPVINSGNCDIAAQNACLADNTLDSLGCYSVYPLGKKAGLKMIVMNTVMFASDEADRHSWHYYGPAGTQQADVEKQMAWLEEQFKEGNPTDAIMIGMHIPPGLDYKGRPNWDDNLTYNGKSVQDAFLDIMGQHPNRIVGLLTSHTHMDGLRKMESASGDFYDLIVSIPGIAPGHGNNPGMKLFTYQPNTFEWMDFTTVYTDYWSTQTVANTWGDASFSFNKIFDNTQGKAISEVVSQTPMTTLSSNVMTFYTAKGQAAGKSDVDFSLIVKPGQ